MLLSQSWYPALERLSSSDIIAITVLVLIFGSGLIAVLGAAVAKVIRAIRGTEDVEALVGRLEHLEGRLQRLERKNALESADAEPIAAK